MQTMDQALDEARRITGRFGLSSGPWNGAVPGEVGDVQFMIWESVVESDPSIREQMEAAGWWSEIERKGDREYRRFIKLARI